MDYTRVQPGDALITFSKVGVLSVAEDLRQAGKKAAIIYGACPTPPGGGRWRLPGRGDAVCGGHRCHRHGLNLPIRRVIFMDTEKFDGVERRELARGDPADRRPGRAVWYV